MTEGKIWAAAEWRACPDHHSSQASLDALLEKQCFERDFGRQCRCPIQNDGMTFVLCVLRIRRIRKRRTNSGWTFDALDMKNALPVHWFDQVDECWMNGGRSLCCPRQEAIDIYTEMHRHLAWLRCRQSPWVSELTAFAWVHDSLNSCVSPQGAKSLASPKKGFGFGRRPSQTWQFQDWMPVNAAEWQLSTISVKPKELLLLLFQRFSRSLLGSCFFFIHVFSLFLAWTSILKDSLTCQKLSL